jgi:hypothetical protein
MDILEEAEPSCEVIPLTCSHPKSAMQLAGEELI